MLMFNTVHLSSFCLNYSNSIVQSTPLHTHNLMMIYRYKIVVWFCILLLLLFLLVDVLLFNGYSSACGSKNIYNTEKDQRSDKLLYIETYFCDPVIYHIFKRITQHTIFRYIFFIVSKHIFHVSLYMFIVLIAQYFSLRGHFSITVTL